MSKIINMSIDFMVPRSMLVDFIDVLDLNGIKVYVEPVVPRDDGSDPISSGTRVVTAYISEMCLNEFEPEPIEDAEELAVATSGSWNFSSN